MAPDMSARAERGRNELWYRVAGAETGQRRVSRALNSCCSSVRVGSLLRAGLYFGFQGSKPVLDERIGVSPKACNDGGETCARLIKGVGDRRALSAYLLLGDAGALS